MATCNSEKINKVNFETELQIGKEGLRKKILQKGNSWKTPLPGDEIQVHYRVKLQYGEFIYSSYDRGKPFMFKLGQGYLYPAMKKSVKTMRKGEIAELTVKPAYYFDGVGLQPNSNLTIHLELLSWKSVVDITGDNKVLKKLIKAGEGYDHPNEGSLARVIYIEKLEDGTVLESKGSDEEPFEYVCLEGQLNESLDRAIMTMRKGEEAIVTINSDSVLYEIKLVDFNKEKPFWKMDTKEKLEACEKIKNEGNVLFKDGKFQCASRKYEKALKFIQFDHSFNEDEKYRANTLRLSCYLNNAACKLKMGEHQEASKLCSKVIGYEPCNVKALFRRAQTYLRINELEKSEIDIRKALEIDPNNRDVKVMYKELKNKQKQYAQHEVEIFSTMLSRVDFTPFQLICHL